MRFLSFFFLFVAPILFSGCLYYPDTYHTLEADRVQQPFTNLWFVNDPGFFSVSIGDSKRNLSTLQVLQVSFKTPSDEAVPIIRTVYDQHSSHFSIVKFYYKKGSFIEGSPFKVDMILDVQGENLTVSGTFSMHSHTKIEYLPEVLDHG